MKKILLYTSILSGGGAERVITQLANFLCNNNEYDVTMCASYKTDNEYYLDKKIKKIYIDSDINNKKSFLQIFRLRKLIKHNKYDKIISFLPNPNFKIMIATIFINVKTIISVRNDPKIEYKSFLNKFLARILYPLADGIVFQTEDASNFFSKKIKRKSRIIMNPVNIKFFNTFKNKEIYYLSVGRLTPQKNFEMLINVFSKFLNKFPNEKLYIYGDCNDNYRITLEKIIKELNCSDNIKLMGRSNNMMEIYSNAKVFIMTSKYEGMPNALLEAQAVGVPCISTDCPCGGPRTIIKDGFNGFLIPVDDYDLLYDRLVLLNIDDKKRKEFSVNSKNESLKFYPDKILGEWKEFIESI